MLAAAAGDRLGALYRTGLMLGLRPGGLLGLRWQDVGIDNGILRVTRALLRQADRWVAQPKASKDPGASPSTTTLAASTCSPTSSATCPDLTFIYGSQMNRARQHLSLPRMIRNA